MLPSETMIWQPEFTDKTLSRKPGAVHSDGGNTPSERCRRVTTTAIPVTTTVTGRLNAELTRSNQWKTN
ncbi:restriction endonuclease [Escherichia coli]|uniref:restriction endonuclease n=1 Tax=Escherichia coli TaxID=562 RepID=UPI000BE59F3E|nr:restriction endonuclease [Escherichia coli]